MRIPNLYTIGSHERGRIYLITFYSSLAYALFNEEILGRPERSITYESVAIAVLILLSLPYLFERVRERRAALKGEQVYTDLGFFHKSVDVWGKLLIGIAGLWFGYLISNQQQQLSKELSEQQRQITEGVSANQIKVQTSQLAAGLINSLLRGDEKERLLALAALEPVDELLWRKFSKIVAENDPDASVRLRAIEGLGRKGDATVRQTLQTIRQDGPTEAERESARRAEANLTSKLNENLKKARTYFELGQLEIAAEYFYEASKYVDESQVDGSKLAVARSHYEHGGKREAAGAFNSLFSKL
jgi:hypothetical protein